MNEIHVTVSGRLVADPEARETGNGVPFAAFRVASSSRRYNPQKQAWEESPASYLNVTAFRGLGINVKASLHKGDPIVLSGRMRINQFVRSDGNPGTSVEVDAYAVGHDLTWGTTKLTRVSRATIDPQDRLSDPSVQAVFQGDGPDSEQDGLDAETVRYVMDDGRGPDGEHPDDPEDGLGDEDAELSEEQGDREALALV